MNTKTHTVTLPIADYQELMEAKEGADKQCAQFRHRLMQSLVDIKINSGSREKQDFINQLIAAVENCQ